MHYSDAFNPFPNKPWYFTRLQYKSFENTVENGETVFPTVFENFPPVLVEFNIIVCKLLQFRQVYTLSFGKG